tara:strand:+ start:13 stop:936 length:924 start_codon:yes stop_codon:yes gene_type:complete
MNIAFVGSPQISAKILEKLHKDGFNIPLVISQPDKRKKRGQSVDLSEVSTMARNLGLNTLKPLDLNDSEFRKEVEAIDIDFLVVSAYGKILPGWMLNVAHKMCINIHYSLLPKYRGSSPIQTSLINGDSETGISFIKMNEKMDEGDLIKTLVLDIKKTDDKISLENRLSTLAANNIAGVLNSVNINSFNLNKQNHKDASYCIKVNKSDGRIDFSDSSNNIINKFRAYKGWPDSYFLYKDTVIKIHEMHELKDAESGIIGEIINFDSNGIVVKTSDTAIVITHLQFPNKKIISAQDANNSYSDFFLKS